MGSSDKPKIAVDIDPPLVPTFVRATVAGKQVEIDVASLPDDVLRGIGAQWTEKLVAHAKRRRDADSCVARILGHGPL